METFITNSAKETEKLGEKFAKELPGRIFALTGELGSGKTTFVKGFARELGVKRRVISPSFIFVRSYGLNARRLYHIDLYRIDSIGETKSLGLEEIWSNPYNIVIIEWAEKIKKILPKERIDIKFEYMDKNKREITIEQ